MQILVIGAGGREHALCWKLAASPMLERLYCAPGNDGMSGVAECVALDIADHDAVIDFCRERRIDLVIVGPEGPLADGFVDDLGGAGIRAFGPSKAAFQLEASKGFAKDFCARHNIPTAAYRRFEAAAPAKAYVEAEGAPIVVKADGLAAGKGVTVAMTKAEALAAIDEVFGGRFGDAGREIVIEEYLQGEEASFFVLSDGRNFLPLATAQDHKPVGEGDKGPNTGGMGACSPAPVMTEAMCAQVIAEIIAPTVDGMAAEGRPLLGVIYAGLMITADGPRLIEYNLRFGDPECQALMARLTSDLVPVLSACMDGMMAEINLRWRDESALVVVLASKGYPGPVTHGSEIGGLSEAESDEGIVVFHAGVRREGARILAHGGRVLGVTALGASIAAAQHRAYAAVDRVHWPEGFCRRDIGWRAIRHEAGRHKKGEGKA